jgi:glycine/sarcosine N-methyltransferase
VSEVPLWDTFSANYDRFVDWEGRLEREMPLLEGLLTENGARRVLDVACGTGHHAIALQERGFQVVAADVSAGMVTEARRNAKAKDAAVTFAEAGLGELGTATKGPFDAVLCLGNSLPSMLSEAALHNALADISAVLAAEGTLFIQNLNYDRVWSRRERFLPLQTHRRGKEEWLFFRFVDFHQETLTFNMVVLHRNGSTWTYSAGATELRPIFSEELKRLLEQTGFADVHFYGDYEQHSYRSDTSGDLIVVARKKQL